MNEELAQILAEMKELNEMMTKTLAILEEVHNDLIASL